MTIIVKTITFKFILIFLLFINNLKIKDESTNVISTYGMFNSATSFNQNIANWNISNITDMSNMFNGATSFNKDLSSWGVDQVTVCDSFASGATAWTKAHPNFSSCTP